MLQQLQADVDHISQANQQLSDELTSHRSEFEVMPLMLLLSAAVSRFRRLSVQILYCRILGYFLTQ